MRRRKCGSKIRLKRDRSANNLFITQFVSLKGVSVLKSKGITVLRVFLTILFVIIVSLTLLTLSFGVYAHFFIDSDVDGIIALAGNAGTPSKMYAVDENGQLVEYASGQISSGKSSEFATYEEMPRYLIDAFIAIEDKRFYSHIGFDVITTVKAAFGYIFSDSSGPGGSTITQQLIKNLTGDDEVSVKRKIQEILRAINLEKKMSKEDIIELYLNTIYLSQGAHGVKAAARLYFDKDISELTLNECAAIAAITQAPTKWDPIQNPENNAYRRDVILTEMLSLGFISEEEFEQAYGKPITLNTNFEKVITTTSSWYTDAVINESIMLLCDKYNVSEKVASQYIYNGGYSIIVSVIPEIQTVVEEYYKNDALFSDTDVQSSFIIIDPENGHVLAMAGGLGEKNGSRVLNRATQTLRSPGSSIKPLSVYTPAFAEGIITYSSCYDDSPVFFGSEYSKNGWPKNSSGVYSGMVDLEYAISHSLNTVAVRILQQIGLENSFDFLFDELRLSSLSESEDKNYSALALGGMSAGVTLKDITTAYSVLANDGVYTSSKCVLKILDGSGNVIIDNKGERYTVVSEGVSQSMTKLLTKVLTNSGATAYGAVTKLTEICEAAGKTGTTDNNKDRWFIGYTPYFMGGIWLGYDTPSSLSSIPSKEHIRVWDSIMAEATELFLKREENQDNPEFDYSLLVESKYCSVSGGIPTEACRLDPRGSCVKTGFFTKDSLPEENCSMHIKINYCTSGNGVAGNACPHEDIVAVGMIVVQRSFPIEVFIKDAEYTAMNLPDGYVPYIHANEPYYKYYSKKGVYTGKSDKSSQYNRFCQSHIPRVSA